MDHSKRCTMLDSNPQHFAIRAVQIITLHFMHYLRTNYSSICEITYNVMSTLRDITPL